jgi:VanZ family protein
VIGLLFLTIALIVYGSLYPWQFDFARHAGNPLLDLLRAWPHVWDRFTVRDFALNLVLYAPLGATAFLVLLANGTTRHKPRPLPILVLSILPGVLLSASMEMLQIYDAHRVCSLLDLISNTAGTLGGAVLALLFRGPLEKLDRRASLEGPRPAAILAVCWFAYQLFPLFPVFSRTHLRAAFYQLASPRGFSLAALWSNAAGWFVAWLALRALFPRLRLGWLIGIAAFVCLPVQIFIVGRLPDWSEIASVFLAAVLWSLVEDPARVNLGWWVLFSAIVVRELAPFHFAAPLQRFSWIPFQASFRSGQESAAIVLFGKAFYYAAGVWLSHLRGWSYWSAGLAIGALLLLLEWAQVYLPARTPEITDAVLAGLMALVLWLFQGAGEKKSGWALRRDVSLK